MAELFIAGEFTLHSGEASNWLIDCDALSDSELKVLARLVARLVPPFGTVEGVPRGGLRIAEALRVWTCEEPRLLIVDDVYTTGQSMEIQRAGREAIGAVLFARRPVTQPWIRALFTLGNVQREPAGGLPWRLITCS